MTLSRFIVGRLVRLAATLLVSSFVIFSALFVAPGNPIATLSGGRSLSPDAVKVLEKRFHLDQPFFTRYFSWLGGVLHGDLGISVKLRQEVSSLISARIATTLLLVLLSSVIILVIGITLGIVAALKEGWADGSVLVITAVSAAIPAFVATTLLLSIFVLNLGWFPAFGSGKGLLDQVRHLVLPSVALAISSLAVVARVTRSAVRDELGREHVQTAVSRGIPSSQILRRHVLRNAAIPIATVSGVTVASLLALSAVVERAFTLNGLGAYLVSAATTNDFAVVQGISLMVVAGFSVTNAVVDVLYAVLDPRIGLGTAAS